jgi:hypothetical protein
VVAELDQQRLQQARRATFEDYRRRNASAWVGPRGTSMRPLIGRDTWMQVEFGAAAIEVGDIILFPLGDILVAHRVVARKLRQGRPALVPKGDAEPYTDPLIAPGEVLGVVRQLRRGKRGPESALGCAGRPAKLIATISRAHGYAAATARRAAAILPGPLRQMAFAAIPPLARVVARITLAPFAWATWLDTTHPKMKGGDLHEL